jgi:hypothetical protein
MVRAEVAFARPRRGGTFRIGPRPFAERSEAEQHHSSGNHANLSPWVPEPGMWAHWEGPRLGGRRTNLFFTWLA